MTSQAIVFSRPVFDSTLRVTVVRIFLAVQIQEELCEGCRLQPGICFRCTKQRMGPAEIQKPSNSEVQRRVLQGIILPRVAILPEAGTVGGNASAVDS